MPADASDESFLQPNQKASLNKKAPDHPRITKMPFFSKMFVIRSRLCLPTRS
jgi:hypothetical protein